MVYLKAHTELEIQNVKLDIIGNVVNLRVPREGSILNKEVKRSIINPLLPLCFFFFFAAAFKKVAKWRQKRSEIIKSSNCKWMQYI